MYPYMKTVCDGTPFAHSVYRHSVPTGTGHNTAGLSQSKRDRKDPTRIEKGDIMAALLNFVEPAPTKLQDWFRTAQVGDRCEVATRGRKLIMSLTKVGLSMVWWSLTDIGKQSNGFAVSMQFSEVLRTWTVVQRPSGTHGLPG